MTLVHTVGFANNADALDFAKAIWKMQATFDLELYCSVCFETSAVEVVAAREVLESLVGALPPLDQEPREC